ncbi:MAG: ABC transporter permease [Acidobacteria bacterium]|nr:ABC transporter permease [Acidobacteriota bacterium]
MSAGEILRTSLGEIRHHKMRSALTLMGIILGTLSITVMTSFLDGVVAAVWSGFNDLGFDGVMYVVHREARDLREKAIATRSRGLQPEDAEVVLARRRSVSAVAPVVYHEEIVRFGDVERKSRVLGVTPSYNVVRARSMEAGRFFNDVDEESFAPVCVLGYRLRKRLFGTEDPLGRSVSVGHRPLRVIGVAEKLGKRKAIGATDFEIFMQFLAESVVLSLIGGLLGVASGIGMIKAVAGFFPEGLPIRLDGLIFALAIALVLGVLYGIYPALKASRMAPVDALRSAA